MQYIKERELELNNLKKENYILIEENRKLKNEIEKAKAFFEERDIIASRMKKIKEEKLEYFNLFLKFCKESVISLDSDLRIIYSSDSFYKMLGSEESMNVDGQYAYDVYSKYRGEENAKDNSEDEKWLRISKFIEENEYIMNTDIRNMFGVSSATASRMLNRFASEGKLQRMRVGSHWGYRVNG